MEIKFNAWCNKCKRMVQVETEDKPKCPNCNSDVEVKGRAIRVTTSNGPYASHI